MTAKQLILASTSPYRQELLKKLSYPFVAMKPLVNEEKEKDPSLSPLALAQKLARLKALSLQGANKIVIGGDQLISFEGKILGKPHTPQKAVEQLMSMQGTTHELITSVALATESELVEFTNITRLVMRKLTASQVERYVATDHPLDCAGSYKIELHGIQLFEEINTSDFTAIQGLPLMELNKYLEKLL